jgi:Mn-dependent DtxR family transcriptional regulator
LLFNLLKLMSSDHTRSLDDLARALDTTPEMVTAMLQELERMGYVRKVDLGCNEHCESCPHNAACVRGSTGSVWIVTSRAS